jgi:hypothetical protein
MLRQRPASVRIRGMLVRSKHYSIRMVRAPIQATFQVRLSLRFGEHPVPCSGAIVLGNRLMAGTVMAES